MALTAKTLIACGVPADVARAQLPHMVRAMRAHRITTRRRGRAFLATVLHESMGLRHMTEIGSGAKYEGRAGNSHAGDGERYKGRGPIQLTGRANYEFYGRLLRLDLVSHPELVATPAVGWQVAACYFAKRTGVLAAADAGDFRKVTKLVNGGYNGWEDRQRYWNKLAKLGVVPGSPDLKRGSRGAEVEALTRKLSRLKSKKTGKPFLPGPRTKFDLKTARAVSAFQREHDLKPDGVLGPRSAEALSRAAKKAKPPAVSAGTNTDGRAEQLWRRLERLDRKSDRVRAGLRTMTAPPLTSVDGLTDTQLVETLERADAQADLLRKALTARIAECDGTQESEDLLVALARELDSVSTRISDVASDHAATAPAPIPAAPAPTATVPAPTPAKPDPTDEAVARLEALDAEADELRVQLERALLAKCENGNAPGGPADPATRSFLERLATLDRLDARSDAIRAALRPRPAEARARTFRVRSPETKGEDIRSWQLFLNRCLREWKVDYEVGVDGEYGKETSRWTKLVLYGLGLSVANWNGLAPQARVKARHPETRTAHELAAARARREWRERLARKHARPKRGKKAALAYAKKHADRRTAETRVNGGPYIDDWCKLVHLQPGTAGAHWCGAFVNACLVKAGLPSRDWLRYTPAIVNNARAGVEGWSWHTRPRVGDLVLFNWPSGDFVDHVGIVVRVNADGSVRTVEGNFQNRVDYWQRKSQILGYARPPWE
jgi:predicted chitinase/peptidoglycan hydrolase-like protein with peptidoglycan-binding domain